MTKKEYLEALRKYLKRLPKEDYESAMEHFTEHFEEAGQEREAEVMEELGTPKEAAGEVLHQLLDREIENGEDVQRKERHSRGNFVLVACLAVMAAPIAAPLAASAVMLILSAVIFLLCAVLAIFLFGVCGLLAGGKLLLRGILAVPYSLSGAGMVMGLGCIGLGIGVFLCLLSVFFGGRVKKWSMLWIQWLLDKIFAGKKKRNADLGEKI